ncbi:DUF4129 domain-containing protein [Deinococcus sp. HMF7620]|uniref:DUF4129 domain-containing protein n=1 Tax=Deinococcus arboris TaxID=2682977 RepID=A0A7C9M4X1_9DEIO|nr:DUF4129 domain-containing protein [Deinococcus arboris]
MTAAQARPVAGRWLRYGVALLPLCLAGALPLWTTAALCALLAAGVRWPVWAQGRVLITQLILGLNLLTALPSALGQGQPSDLLTLGAQYLLLSVLGFVLTWGINTLEEGQRRGLLAPLLIGALFPQPFVLVALFGGALARQDQKAADLTSSAPRGWWSLLGAGLLGLVLLAALLPPAPPVWSAVQLDTITSELPPRTDTRPQSGPVGRAERGGTGGQVMAQPSPVMDLGQLGFPAELTLLAGLLCLVGAARLFQGRGRRQSPPHPAELLMIVGLLVLGIAWLVTGVLLWRGGAGGGAIPPAATIIQGGQSSGPEGQLTAARFSLLPLLQLLPWLTAIMFLAMGVWLLRLKLRPDSLSGDVTEEAATPADPAEAQPLHRVRQAYRAALGALADAGLGRAPHETPALYAARLTGGHPSLAAPLHTLTAAYEPVRYGGQLTDQTAEAAEAAAHTIQTIAPTLTPPEATP